LCIHKSNFNKPLKGGPKSILLALTPLGMQIAEGFAAGVSLGAGWLAQGTLDPHTLAAAWEQPRPSDQSRGAGTWGSEMVHNVALNLAARLTCFS